MQRWNGATKLARDNGGNTYKGKCYSDTIADVVDNAMSQKEQGVWVTPQWGTIGGKHSMIRKENRKNPNVLSQRDASMSHLYYIHFDSVRDGKDTKNPRARARKNLREMIKRTNALLGPEDRRWLAFCGEDENLDRIHSHYYDSEEDYQGLLALKRQIDPKDIFTPNLFCIGASRKFGVAPLGVREADHHPVGDDEDELDAACDTIKNLNANVLLEPPLNPSYM